MKKSDKTLFILAFVLFWNAALSPDVFYYPSEYRDQYNDSYALDLELSQLRIRQKNQLGNLLSIVMGLEEKVKALRTSFSGTSAEKAAELSRLNAQIAETSRNIHREEQQHGARVEALQNQMATLRKTNSEDQKQVASDNEREENQLKGQISNLKKKSVAERNRSDQSLQIAHNEIEEYRALLADRKKKFAAMEAQANELESKLKAEIAQGHLRVKRHDNRLVITMDEKILFASGSAKVKQNFIKTLDKIAKLLAHSRKNNIIIEGHTDNVSIHTAEYMDNWELSTARATAVLRILLRRSELTASRFSAAGYGEFQPVAPNNSGHNRQINRRVDIVILQES